MASPERTAYPNLRKPLSDEELHARYTLTEQEQRFVQDNANGQTQRLTLLVMLKTSRASSAPATVRPAS